MSLLKSYLVLDRNYCYRNFGLGDHLREGMRSNLYVWRVFSLLFPVRMIQSAKFNAAVLVECHAHHIRGCYYIIFKDFLFPYTFLTFESPPPPPPHTHTHTHGGIQTNFTQTNELSELNIVSGSSVLIIITKWPIGTIATTTTPTSGTITPPPLQPPPQPRQ